MKTSLHNLFYWMSQHLPMRVCQFFYDRSRSFRVWWGIDGPPIPRTPYARAELRVQKFYGGQDLVLAGKLAEKMGFSPLLQDTFRKRVAEAQAVLEDGSEEALLAYLKKVEPITEDWTPYHEYRLRTDPPPWGRGFDDCENYTGPEESVECAYPPCDHRLLRSEFEGPQWCSKECRELTEKKPDPAFGPDENDAHRLSGFRGYMS